ncbi:MAG: sodium:proton antiporter [Sedimenticola sp.]
MDNPFVSATLSLMILLLIAALVKPVAERSRVPFPVLLVVVGMGLGLTSTHWEVPWSALTESSVFIELIMVILLPTLVFETAASLDTDRLLDNYKAILYLAVPGLLISAGIITLVVGLLTGLDWGFALLLGIILSATDPAAVIAEFRRLGTPRDLNLLVEGESLFNDATTIVLTKIVVVALGAGIAWQQMVFDGAVQFLVAMIGGIVNGWIFGRLAYWLLVRLRSDPFVGITLTLLLAYGSYLSAEYLFHTSGIISTAVAGLVLAKERPLPIPHRVEQYLGSLWSFLSYVATILIFLMVGLITKPELLLDGLDVAAVVILGMLLSRGVMIYGLLPAAGHLRRHPRKVRMAYRHILNWGGLRGAVTLALAMGLSGMIGDGHLLSVALVAVLFTIIVQGLSIGRLAHSLKLDIPEAPERISQAESWLSAKKSAKRQLADLADTPFAHTGAPAAYEKSLDEEMTGLQIQLSHWRSEEEGPVGEWQRFLLRGLSLEVTYIYKLFDQGLLPPKNYIQLRRSLTDQIEALRHDYPRPEFELLKGIPAFWRRIVASLPIASPREKFAAQDYLSAWARRLSSGHAMKTLESLMELDQTSTAVRQDVLKIYLGWHEEAKKKIATIEELFPGVADGQQRYMVQQLSLTAQIQNIEQQTKSGLLNEGEAEQMIHQLLAGQKHPEK